MKKIFVGASWKMNKTVKESLEYVSLLKGFISKNEDVLKNSNVEVFILPTHLPLYPISLSLADSYLKFGAQNSFWADEGAYTGEVSPMHLKEIGCSYIELGHPERLYILKEDEQLINRKIIGVLKNGLTPILCIGEEEEHDKKHEVYDFLIDQIRAYFKDIDREDINKILLAYEPVWAIGADKSAPVDYISDSLDFIRSFLSDEYGSGTGKNQMIIYGGSVNPASAFEILKLRNNNGIFIGRASLKFDYFTNMINMAVDAASGASV
jgi:triosephosphate isomerase